LTTDDTFALVSHTFAMRAVHLETSIDYW